MSYSRIGLPVTHPIKIMLPPLYVQEQAAHASSDDAGDVTGDAVAGLQAADLQNLQRDLASGAAAEAEKAEEVRSLGMSLARSLLHIMNRSELSTRS